MTSISALKCDEIVPAITISIYHDDNGQMCADGEVIPRKTLAAAAMRRISAQFYKADKAITPEAKLMLAIIQQAVSDTVNSEASNSDRVTALSYLKNDLRHAELCGVSADWIRETLEECNIFEPMPE